MGQLLCLPKHMAGIGKNKCSFQDLKDGLPTEQLDHNRLIHTLHL